MFIGHFAVGLAAKRFAPKTSLVPLMVAPLLLDLIWPLLLLAGVEHAGLVAAPTPFLVLDLYDYPWSHSLVTALGWSLAFALVWGLPTGDRRGAVVVGLGVFSHWVLDFVTHRPDMPLYPGDAGRVGLGLWYSVPGTVLVEGALFVAGVVLYLRTTRARGVLGHVALWSLIIFLTVGYTMSVLGPPPPSIEAVRWAGLFSWRWPGTASASARSTRPRAPSATRRALPSAPPRCWVAAAPRPTSCSRR